jgi:uncharacterized protein
MKTMTINNKFIVAFFLLLFAISGYSQSDSIPNFAVFGKGKVKDNKILLKWMVNDPILWKKSLTNGYKIQRTTITKDGNPIMRDETVTLHEKLVPLPLNDWRPIATKDTIAMVVAQAIYGKQFQVAPPKKGISEIMLLNEQNEQRYAFAIMAAEQSFEATKAAGWGIEDSTAKPNEKYVYTITLLGLEKSIPNATIYIGLGDKFGNAGPQNIEAMFGNQTVMVIWEYKLQKEQFSCYNIERSEDGVKYVKLNKTPIYSWETKSSVVTYSDKLAENNKTYYYRIRGIDVFGEISEPSKAISGQGADILEYSPQIIAKSTSKEDEVDLEWQFPNEGESKIKEFQILKSDTQDGIFELVKDKILPITRKDKIKTPLKPSNYFIVKAVAPNGSSRSSFSALVQVIDSIAPMPPLEVQGEIDTLGVVKLKWKKNIEPDMYGYKVFRGYFKDKEFSQLTKLVLLPNSFKDTIDMKALNRTVYYKIMAIDKRYNESLFSKIIEIKKLDKIAPSAPVISDYEIGEGNINIKFFQSSSDDVKKHILYRKNDSESKWKPIYEFADKKILEYIDKDVTSDKKQYYTIMAVDETGNESQPSEPLIVNPLPKLVKQAIKNFGFLVDRKNKNIELFWSSKEKKISEYQLFKRKKDATYTLYRIFEPQDKVRFVDEVLSPGNIYQYAVKCFFEDGTSSKIEEITVEY